MNLPLAEKTRYWKSSQASTDTILDKAEKVIEQLGGEVQTRTIGKTPDGGKGFLIQFTIGGESFRIHFPVLPTRSGNTKAAERQAATLIFHDVKAKALRAHVFGTKSAFFEFRVLDDGSNRTVGQLALPELIDCQPKLLT